MLIRDPNLICKFRYSRVCEACGERGVCDVAHLYSKGAGGPDTSFNLLALGTSRYGNPDSCNCHHKSHYGDGKSFEGLRAIIAKRECCDPNDIDMLVHGIRWILPKSPTFSELRAWLNTLSPRAEEIAEQIPALSRILLGEAA